MEYLDIVDENDKVIGREERELAHKKQLLHRIVEIFIINDEGEILCQKRSMYKKQFPRFWISSAGGHVESKETPNNTAIKELKEELGIKTKLKFIGKIRSQTKIDNEICYIYVGYHNGPFLPEKNEVSKIKFIMPDKIIEEIGKDKMTPCFIKGLELYLKTKEEV